MVHGSGLKIWGHVARIGTPPDNRSHATRGPRGGEGVSAPDLDNRLQFPQESGALVHFSPEKYLWNTLGDGEGIRGTYLKREP